MFQYSDFGLSELTGNDHKNSIFLPVFVPSESVVGFFLSDFKMFKINQWQVCGLLTGIHLYMKRFKTNSDNYKRCSTDLPGISKSFSRLR